jgi:hypothetical protein
VKWENLLLLPFAGFVFWPLAALVPAGAFAAAYAARRRTSSLIAAAAWGAYAIYESLMKARILCSGECNIRVDLLLILPVLWILAIVALVQFFRKRHA